MNPKYYGIYQSRNASGGKTIATTAQDLNVFPPNISYNGQNYSLTRAIQVSTPGQELAFYAYCTTSNIDPDISI